MGSTTISGVALRPSVSRNNREYTRGAIASAVHRAQARIAEGSKPLTMLSHHDAGDDTTRVVGRVTAMSLDVDGSARYEAELADTEHARTITNLIDPASGNPFVSGVSIRGAWAAPVQRKVIDGKSVEYADDLELHGLDFTHMPGVDGARVDTVTRSPSGKQRETDDGRPLIFESVEEAVITETTPTEPDKPTETVTYADPGYLADGKSRLPVDTREGLRAAWETVRETSTDTTYTDRQKRRIRERVGKAATKLGYDVTPTGWLVSAPVAESEVWPDRPGSYCVNVDNGMVAISVSSWRVDPADLEVCARAAMEGACAALAAIDPDADGDLDAPDDGMESAPPVDGPRESTPNTTPDPAATEVAETEEKEGTGMAEPTTPEAGQAPAAAPVETTTPAPTEQAAPTPLDVMSAKFDGLVAAIGGLVDKLTPAPVVAAESAPAAPVTETAPAVEESADDKLARLVQEGIKAALPAAVQAHVEENGVQRKGLVAEHTAPSAQRAADEYPETWPRDDKGAPKATLTDQELYQVSNTVLPNVIYGLRQR